MTSAMLFVTNDLICKVFNINLLLIAFILISISQQFYLYFGLLLDLPNQLISIGFNILFHGVIIFLQLFFPLVLSTLDMLEVIFARSNLLFNDRVDGLLDFN